MPIFQNGLAYLLLIGPLAAVLIAFACTVELPE